VPKIKSQQSPKFPELPEYPPTRLSRWACDPEGNPLVSHTTKAKWRKEGLLRCIEFSGNVFVLESFADFLRRMKETKAAAEQPAAAE